MSTIRTSLPIPTQPWEAARAKFLEGLSPQEIQRFKDATPENLFYDASAVQKRHADNSKTWLFQERLSSLTDAINDYGKALDVYANANGLILSPIWGSVRVVLHIAGEAGKFQENVVDMLAQIGDVLPRFRIYQTLFKDHERLLVALSAAFLDILQFCVITKNFFARAKKSMIPLVIVLKGSWKPYRRDFENCMLGFRKHTKRVEREAGLAHMIESARTREIALENRAIRIRNEKLQQRYKTLAALPSVDYSTKHMKLLNLRHPGTNNWLQATPKFLSWYDNSTSDCLCCYGIPGSGKSVLSASLVGHLREVTANEAESLLCYFYCDYADTASLEPFRLLGSIIKQGLERLPLDHFGDAFESPFCEGQIMPTLSESSKYCLSVLQHFKTIYFVIDGIDELASDSQIIVLDFISSLLHNPFITAKVFVASRLEEHLIKRTLKPYPSLRLTKECVRGDIALVIDEQIRSTVTRQNPLLEDESLRQEVVDALVSRADDMFLWVKFQLYDIGQALTESAIRSTIRNLPKDISETYMRIIERIHRTPGGETTFEIMQNIFRWVAGARRPLQIEELEEAVGLERTDTHLHTERLATNAGERLVACCGNLVVFNEEDSTVTFAHHTVKQFLHSSSRSQDSTFSNIHFSPQSANDHIAEICLAYLSFADFETQVVKTSDVVNFERELAEQIVWANTPLAKPLRSLVSWSKRVRGAPQLTQDMNIKFATPVSTTVFETLSRKYVMLNYIITYWAFHATDMRPESYSWGKFKRIVLYQQLVFEFRPWNELEHRTMVKATISDLQNTTKLDESSRDLLLYSWAMRHGSSAFLRLVDLHSLYGYIRSTGRLKSTFIMDKISLDTFESFRTFVLSCPSSEACPNGFWNADLITHLMRGFNEESLLTNHDCLKAFDFIKFEIERWVDVEGALLDKIFVGASISALQSGETQIFQLLAEFCVRTYKQLATMLDAVTENGLTSEDALVSLLVLDIHEKCSLDNNCQLVIALERCLPYEGMISILRGLHLSRMWRMPFTIQRAYCALLLATSKRPSILGNFINDTPSSNKLLNRLGKSYPLPRDDGTDATFGIIDTDKELQHIVDNNLIQVVMDIGLVAEHFLGHKLYALYALNHYYERVVHEIVILVNKAEAPFHGTAIELGGIHCLEWAIEADVSSVIKVLAPHCKGFIHGRMNKEDVLRVLRAGRQSQTAMSALVGLIPLEIFKDFVEDLTWQGCSQVLLAQDRRKIWLEMVRQHPEISSFQDLATKLPSTLTLFPTEWHVILSWAFDELVSMVQEW